MHAAYDGLPAEMKRDLEGMTVLHDFNKFWEMNGAKKAASATAHRGAEESEAAGVAPGFSHASNHQAQGALREPRLSIRINELPERESDRTLEFLFRHS